MEDEASFSNSVVIGVAVGVSLLVLMLLAAAASVCVIILDRRRKKEAKDNRGIHNPNFGQYIY